MTGEVAVWLHAAALCILACCLHAHGGAQQPWASWQRMNVRRLPSMAPQLSRSLGLQSIVFADRLAKRRALARPSTQVQSSNSSTQRLGSTCEGRRLNMLTVAGVS